MEMLLDTLIGQFVLVGNSAGYFALKEKGVPRGSKFPNRNRMNCSYFGVSEDAS